MSLPAPTAIYFTGPENDAELDAKDNRKGLEPTDNIQVDNENFFNSDNVDANGEE